MDWGILVAALIAVLVAAAVLFVFNKYSRDSLEQPFSEPPDTTGVYYYCDDDDVSKLVSYYEPDNPPRCPKCGKKLTRSLREVK